MRADNAVAPAKPAVLFTGSEMLAPNYLFARWLEGEGFALQSHPSLESQSLTWEEARHFNVIVLAGLGMSKADGTLDAYDQETIATLNRFLQEGGSILFFPDWREQKAMVPPQEAFLKPLGLTPLFDEVVFDPANAVTATLYNVPMAHTTDIAKSSITEGVTSLWYPSGTRVGWEAAEIPFLADPSWTTVVKSMPTSHSSTISLDRMEPGNGSEPGKFKTSVPLVAYRQVGKGRIVYYGIDPAWLCGSPAPFALGAIVGEKGLNGIPSHGNQLFLNSLKWLAETSHGNVQLGGATTDATMSEDPYATKFNKPADWSTGEYALPMIPVSAIRACPGVIGARTALSGGKGTVEDWVRQAKAMGLSYLVFLEDFSQLSAENFAKLNSECLRLTDANFAAVPGFRIDDVVGNHYYYFGASLPYPKKEFLTDDGKAWRSYDPQIPLPKDSAIGQIEGTLVTYTYDLAGFKLTSGNYLYRAGASPFANFFGCCDTTGVITRRNGKIIEDALPEYLQIIGTGMGSLPLVIDMMDDPAELKQTPWRTVVRVNPGPQQTNEGMLDGVNPIVAFWTLWHWYPDTPTRIYITNGPVIDSWTLDGSRDYEGSNRGDFVWQNLRFREGGKVSSDVGLKELDVYDGTKLFRRFLPQGAKQFEFVMNLNHDKQHNLVLIATDLNGNRAISGDQWDRNHRMEEYYVGDRDNQLFYSYDTRKDGSSVIVGGTGSTPYKRVPPMVITPAGLFACDHTLGTAGFDGSPGGESIVCTPVTLLGQDGKTILPPEVGDAHRLLNTGDTHIGNSICDYDFTDGVTVFNVWHTLWRTQPAKDFSMELRNQLFSIDPDNPIATWVLKERITLKHDLPNQGLHAAYLQNGTSTRWVVRDSQGKLTSGSMEVPLNPAAKEETVPFDLGGYAGQLDSAMGSTAIFSLTDGMKASWQQPDHKVIDINLLPGKTPQKKGESCEVSLLLLGIPRLTEHSTTVSTDTMATLARFGRDFGLTTAKPTYSADVNAGQIVSQHYILHVDGAKENGFSGKLTGDLIAKLPIEVSGLNDHWSAMLYDRHLGKARPIGLYANEAWATVPLHGHDDLFVGHPVTCDNRDIVLQFTQIGDHSWRLEAHNPTDVGVTVNLTANRFFDPLKNKTISAKPVTIPAGTSIFFDR